MSINNLFEKGNKFFLLQNHIAGLEIYKEIWFKYPKNTRLDEEIKKKVKKFKISVPLLLAKIRLINFLNYIMLVKQIW